MRVGAVHQGVREGVGAVRPLELLEAAVDARELLGRAGLVENPDQL